MGNNMENNMGSKNKIHNAVKQDEDQSSPKVPAVNYAYQQITTSEVKQAKHKQNKIVSTDQPIALNYQMNIVLVNQALTEIDLRSYCILRMLILNANKIKNIDLSRNPHLASLSLTSNQLQNITISSNTQLSHLDLCNNKISYINLSKNVQLTSLNLSKNSFSSVDVSNNTKLTKLYIYSNKLSQLHISNNTQLGTLFADKNKLTQIDLSYNEQLCFLSLKKNRFSQIDLSENINLMTLNLQDNNLSKVDYSDKFRLQRLQIGNNALESMVLWFNPKMKWGSYFQSSIKNQRTAKCTITVLTESKDRYQCKQFWTLAMKQLESGKKLEFQNKSKCQYVFQMIERQKGF